MRRKTLSTRIQKSLLIPAGGRCSKCRELLARTENKITTNIENFHHIYPVSSEEAYFNPNMSEDELNDPENILVVCPNCHREIHGNPRAFPPIVQLDLKRIHEEWVKSQPKIIEEVIQSVPADFDVSISKQARPEYSGTCVINETEEDAHIWTWIEGYTTRKIVTEIGQKITKLFGDKFCVKQFNDDFYLMRTHTPMNKVLFGLRKKTINGSISIFENPEKLQERQLNIRFRDHEELPPFFKGVLQYLRPTKKYPLSECGLVEESSFIIQTLHKPLIQVNIVPKDSDILPRVIIGSDISIQIEEMIAFDNIRVIILRFSAPLGRHELFWQLIPPSGIQIPEFKGPIGIDVGWTGAETEFRFWIPKIPKPSSCIEDCSQCNQIHTECFDVCFLGNMALEELVPDYNVYRPYLGSDHTRYDILLRKEASDIYKNNTTDLEKREFGDILSKAWKKHENVLSRINDLESYLRINNLSMSQKTQVINIVEEIRFWVKQGGEYRLIPEAFKHEGYLTTTHLDKILERFG